MKVLMTLPGGFCLRSGVPAISLLVFGAFLLSIGCVSLDKPAAVKECAAWGTCSDDPNAGKKDAADAVVEPDVGPKEETPAAKDDAGPDLGPDAATDGSTQKQDVLGPEPTTNDDVGQPDRGPETVRKDVPNPTDLDAGTDDVATAKDDVAGPETIREDVPKADVAKDEGPSDLPQPDVGPDVWGPEVQAEVGPDAGAECKIFYGTPSSGTPGHPPGPGSSAAFCIATCDDIQGWGCSNFDSGRQITVNGVPVTCNPATALTKKNGYYVFRVSAGSNPAEISAVIYWWGTYATSCTAPAGGF
jgi:hypothetical protein